MKIYSMSKKELQIALLKNISEIFVYDLLVPRVRDGKKVVKTTFLGIMVFCDSSTILNYCENDKLFEKFKIKLLNQYMLEKDIRKIKMDSRSKDFVDNSLKIEGMNIPKVIEESISDEESLIKEGKKKFRKFESILKYNLDILSKYLGKNFNLTEIKGFRDHLNIGDKLSIIIRRIDENSVDFELLGLLESVEFVKAKIRIDSNSIKFFIDSSDGTISMHSSFENKEKGIERVITINSNKDLQYYDSGIMSEALSEEEQNRIDVILNNELHSNEYKNIYKLPWNGYFTSNYDDLFRQYSYVELRDDYILCTSYDEKIYEGDNGYSIKTSGGKEKTEIFRVDNSNIGVIETYYSDVPYALGIYKDKLSNNYYYFVGKFDDFENPGKLTIEPIEGKVELEHELFEVVKRKGK